MRYCALIQSDSPRNYKKELSALVHIHSVPQFGLELGWVEWNTLAARPSVMDFTGSSDIKITLFCPLIYITSVVVIIIIVIQATIFVPLAPTSHRTDFTYDYLSRKHPQLRSINWHDLQTVTVHLNYEMK